MGQTIIVSYCGATETKPIRWRVQASGRGLPAQYYSRDTEMEASDEAREVALDYLNNVATRWDYADVVGGSIDRHADKYAFAPVRASLQLNAITTSLFANKSTAVLKRGELPQDYASIPNDYASAEQRHIEAAEAMMSRVGWSDTHRITGRGYIGRDTRRAVHTVSWAA